MSRNYITTHIELSRIEMCDLLLACTTAQYAAGDGGKKWEELHDKINKEIEKLDKKIDSINKMF